MLISKAKCARKQGSKDWKSMRKAAWELQLATLLAEMVDNGGGVVLTSSVITGNVLQTLMSFRMEPFYHCPSQPKIWVYCGVIWPGSEWRFSHSHQLYKPDIIGCFLGLWVWGIKLFMWFQLNEAKCEHGCVKTNTVGLTHYHCQ